MSCIFLSMHGCIWVYMCMHHGVGGVHVRMYMCVCMSVCSFECSLGSFSHVELLSNCEVIATFRYLK